MILAADQKWRFGQKLDYRQEWRHQGFTLGELVSSLSLLPNEELTVEISSWQRSKSEVSEATEQETRERLERELRRTDEESATNEAAATEGWSVSGTGSVSYGPASASITASASSNTENRATAAERHITDATSKAANEISLKRAVKITQTAEAGSESRSTRRIRNENGCHTVTFSFFQVVKLYNVQIRVDNDAPTVMLPGLFPATYSDNTPVEIPYDAIESFTSPANFLTQFFEVDRDLSDELNGWGLRVRCNSLLSPELAVRQVAEALIVVTFFLLRLNPADHLDALGAMVANYVRQARALRARAVEEYGPGRGQSEQLVTPGIYADSMMGRCTACDQFAESRKYVEVMTGEAERAQIEISTALADLERQRRAKRLEGNKLDPFEAAPIVPKS